MTDLEIDSIAEGLLKFLMEKSESPLDGLAILGLALLKVFDSCRKDDWTIQAFSEDIKQSLLESYAARSSEGSERLQ